MRRRALMALVASTAALPLSAAPVLAQRTPAAKRVAIVHPALPVAEMNVGGANAGVSALLEELRHLGYVEGRNLVVERHSGDGRTERYAELARDVVRSAPDVIVTFSNRMAQHFLNATSAIPIVAFAADPAGLGLVASLSRPGGNITGVAVDAGLEIWGKRFELLKAIAPMAHRVGFLAPGIAQLTDYRSLMRAAAERAGSMLLDVMLDTAIDEVAYRRFFARLMAEGAGGLVVNESGENLTHHRVLVEAARAARLPTIYPWREPVLVGGLLAYTYNIGDLGRHAAIQVDRILRGEQPGEIPFRQPERFDLIVNARAAAELGLTVPQSLLVRADEVIE